MNIYVSVITEIIEHIECNIGERLQLAELSARAGISDFHFNRMFKTVAGITLKQYVLGRKLTHAKEQLVRTHKPVIEIAMDLGFEYPEVFSRAFKKQFGIAPSAMRHRSPGVQGVEKAVIVERDIVNYRGALALKGEVVFLDPMALWGIQVKADASSGSFKEDLMTHTERFISASADSKVLKKDHFYTIVCCSGRDDWEYDIFCGREAEKSAMDQGLASFAVPGGWYVDFIYHGDMFAIRDVFIDDLYKWIMVKEAEINPNGIGMLTIYENSYPVNNGVHILVPIKKPV